MRGPPEIKQRGFDDVLIDWVRFRLRLRDNGHIEAPGHLAELVAGAGQACAEHQRLGLNAGACAGRHEAFPSGFDRGLIMPFNHFQFWGNVTCVRNRHDRTVKQNDSRQVGVQCRSDRNSIIAGRVRLGTDIQINDHVFDHRYTSFRGRR
jgi:hypothetical protein